MTIEEMEFRKNKLERIKQVVESNNIPFVEMMEAVKRIADEPYVAPKEKKKNNDVLSWDDMFSDSSEVVNNFFGFAVK